MRLQGAGANLVWIPFICRESGKAEVVVSQARQVPIILLLRSLWYKFGVARIKEL